jgi:DNA-binding SARP family transcriptional activator
VGLLPVAAHDLLAGEHHLRAAVALFPRTALADLGGRWARRTRDALEVEALEAHVVLADLLRNRRPQPDAAGAEEVMARFFLPTFGLWEELVRTRLDAGADDVLAAAVRTAPVVFGTRYDDPEADTLGALLSEAAERVLPGRTPSPAGPRSRSAPPLELTLYGPFRVRRRGTDATPTQPERAAVLAALVAGRGTVVPWRDLAAAGWPGRPADDVRAAVRRSVLGLSGLTSSTRPRVAFTEHPDGWQLDLPDPCTDADRVETLVQAGTDLLTRGAARSAVEPLTVAADLCSRRALDSLPDKAFDVPRGRLEVLAETVALRLADALVDGVLVGGEDPESALARLKTLVGRHPAVLGLRERLMTGYHLAGRPFDAVGVHDTAVRDLGPVFTGRAADAMRTLDRDITRAGAARRASGVRFRVLDGTGLDVLGRPTTLATRDARRALAVLLLRRRSVVPSAELVEAVWDGRTANAESSARWIVDSLLHNVELATQPVFGTPSEAEREARQSPLTVTAVTGGWVADLPPESLDLDVVAGLAAQGTEAWGRGDAAAAADALRAALGKLPVDPFPRLGGSWFDAERARLVTWRTELVALAVRAELACARYADALPDLERLVAARPQDEELTGELVTALAAVGRTGDARAAYDRCAAALRRTLGTSPGPTLQMLLRRLTGE